MRAERSVPPTLDVRQQYVSKSLEVVRIDALVKRNAKGAEGKVAWDAHRKQDMAGVKRA